MLNHLKICDPDYHLLSPISVKNDKILWNFSISIETYHNVNVIMEGCKNGLNPLYKNILKEFIHNFNIVTNQLNTQAELYFTAPFSFPAMNNEIIIKEISIWSTNFDITFLNIKTNLQYTFNFEDLVLLDAFTEKIS